jgi:hypothetical protein
MRVRIVQSPKGQVDGVEMDLLHVGATYDLSLPLAGLLLLEGWAVPEQRKENRPGRPVFSHVPALLLASRPKFT